jgi:hypothetical protein
MGSLLLISFGYSLSNGSGTLPTMRVRISIPIQSVSAMLSLKVRQLI